MTDTLSIQRTKSVESDLKALRFNVRTTVLSLIYFHLLVRLNKFLL